MPKSKEPRISESTIESVYGLLDAEPKSMAKLVMLADCGETSVRSALFALQDRGQARRVQSRHNPRFNNGAKQPIRLWLRA